MKTLFRVIIVITFLALIFYISSADSTKPLESPETEISQVNEQMELAVQNSTLTRPEEGISTYIGQSSDVLLEDFGKPDRIDVTPYNYYWWAYNRYETYVMFAVKDEEVMQVYTNSTAYSIQPYEMYMDADEIYRMTIVDGEITVKLEGDNNIYLYSMSDYDTKYRLLVQLGDIYAQVYVDKNDDKLTGIRFMTGESLVEHHSYNMQVIGELPGEETILYTDAMNKANKEQLYDLVNSFRLKEKLPILSNSFVLSNIAQNHSNEMFENGYVSDDSPITGSLKDRAASIGLIYEKIDENIASGFYDAIEATHQLINSNKHRKLIYDKSFHETGIGVQGSYYTQIFFDPIETAN